MECPFCGFIEHKVLESRAALDFGAIRRRRECLGCGRRFTTYERAERPRLWVVKRNGARQEFDREKIFASMELACRKRRVPVESVREAAERAERELYAEYEDEVTTSAIGQVVMQQLAQLDVVAYIRFASVYREFESVTDFQRIVDETQGLAVPVAQPRLAL